MGCFIYIFLGTCKDVPVGPTAIAALLTYQTAGGVIQKAILLSFLTGIIELLMGVLGLGFLIDFVSGPVSSGFTSAVALIICTSQVKDILAISAKGTTFVQVWSSIFENIQDTQAWDTSLGLVCIAVLLIMRTLGTIKIGPSQDELKSKTHHLFNKFLWFVSTARNAILVVVCGVLGYVFEQSGGEAPFKLIGAIPPGLPSFQMPPFNMQPDTDESFGDMVASMGSGLIVVPLIALMENIAICKAFGNGKAVDATQELIAIGTSNIVNSFAQGFPGTGSLSRGAVNNASGARTPLGSLYAGLLVVLSLMFLTPMFAYIPKSALAAIIIAAVVFMVEVKVIKPMWRSKSKIASFPKKNSRDIHFPLFPFIETDLIPGLGAFFACLILPLEIGILTGIGINMAFILYHTARPKICIEQLESPQGVQYLMVTPDRCLIFPSVDYVRTLITKQATRLQIPVVIDCTHIYGTDFTAANVVQSVCKDFAQRDQLLFFYNLKPSACAIFEAVEPVDFVVYYREEQIDELLVDRGYKPKPNVTV